MSDKSSPSRRLLVILHGKRIENPDVRSAIVQLQEEGYDITVRPTYQGGDVEMLIKEALAYGPVDTIVAAGGDGTLTEVVDALLKHPEVLEHTSVGLLPLGTCNSFARTTGIPIDDPYSALVLAADPERMHLIDVGLLNGKVFMNTATVGASTDLGKVTSPEIKKLLGPAAFFFTGAAALANWRPVKANMLWAEAAKLNKDDIERGVTEQAMEQANGNGSSNGHVSSNSNEEPNGSEAKGGMYQGAVDPTIGARIDTKSGKHLVAEQRSVEVLNITAANNRQAGNLLVAPHALLDDGMLDVMYLTGDLSHQVSELAAELAQHGTQGEFGDVHMVRAPWFEVTFSEPTDWSVDGESHGDARATHRFEVLARKIRMHLPDHNLLSSGATEDDFTDIVPTVREALFGVNNSTVEVFSVDRAEAEAEEAAAEAEEAEPEAEAEAVREPVTASRDVSARAVPCCKSLAFAARAPQQSCFNRGRGSIVGVRRAPARLGSCVAAARRPAVEASAGTARMAGRSQALLRLF